jgi:hypothetical protein
MDSPAIENALHDTVSVELPRRRKVFALFVLLALLTLFGLVLVKRLSAWNRLPHDPATYTDLILFVSVTILSILTHCWRAWARHWIRVSPSELIFEIEALGLNQIRRYPRSEVSNLRVDERRVFTYRPWLAIDRNGKRKFLGDELERSKLDGLLEPIYSQFPATRTQTHTI